MSLKQFVPANFQPNLQLNQFILKNFNFSNDSLALDVVFVGAGPAGLAGAIELARLVRIESAKNSEFPKIEIGVLEKSQELGGHCLSGAIINPKSLLMLFPELKISDFPFRSKVSDEAVYILTENNSVSIPIPPTMHNKDNYIVSICELVRWLGSKAEELNVNIFTGFPAASLIMNNSNQVVGLRTTPTGLDRNGKPTPHYTPPSTIKSQYVVLCEGTRGSLTQAYLKTQDINSKQPQSYSLGIKEIWRIKHKSPKSIIHTMGWPLDNADFGGGFLYPMSDDLIAIGIVVGLDYKQHNLDVHNLLQKLKTHPLFKHYLTDGELVEWGAKTIPEGGFNSIASRLHGDGILITGDAAGFVNVPTLKGIHYAIESGRLAAHTIFAAIKKKDISSVTLQQYDKLIRNSFIWTDLYRVRNMRQAFSAGIYKGGIKASLMALTNGRYPITDLISKDDAAIEKTVDLLSEIFPKNIGISKTDAVFYSGNRTRDNIPQHLHIGTQIPYEVAQFYSHMCPANVYMQDHQQLIINPANCIDCKATDVLGPRWSPREGGSGPNYKIM
jgi:electron-transferring-flavoprotein dehydrogenase